MCVEELNYFFLGLGPPNRERSAVLLLGGFLLLGFPLPLIRGPLPASGDTDQLLRQFIEILGSAHDLRNPVAPGDADGAPLSR